MEIIYLDGATFQIKGDRTVTVNPPPAMAVDIVLHSVRQKSSKQIVNGPGEYEIGGVLIATVEVGPRQAATLVHGVEVGGVNVVHLGMGEPELDERAFDALGAVDVLLVNADEPAAAQAAVRNLEPRIVIPFGPKAAELCAALGVKEPRAEPRFSWNGLSAAPKAVLLKATRSRKRAA